MIANFESTHVKYCLMTIDRFGTTGDFKIRRAFYGELTVVVFAVIVGSMTRKRCDFTYIFLQRVIK